MRSEKTFSFETWQELHECLQDLKQKKAREVTADFTMIQNDERANGDKIYQITALDENIQHFLTIKNVDVAKEDGSTIARLSNIVSDGITFRKSDRFNALPDVVCFRHNHYLISVYCESKIAEEKMKEENFVLPDGTSRQGTGDIAGMVVKVGDKICALKSLNNSKGDRSNWATVILHMLDHLATASKVEIKAI